MNPEEQARLQIDRMLVAAGWTIQDLRELNLGASLGVVVREFPLKNGEADYLLLVERKAVGVVEAKPEGDLRDPDPRSRPVFSFHKPETLREWTERRGDPSWSPSIGDGSPWDGASTRHCPYER